MKRMSEPNKDDELLLMERFFDALSNQDFVLLSGYFHSTVVVIENEVHRVLHNKEQHIEWLQEFAQRFGTNLKETRQCKVSSSKTLSEKLKFSLVKLIPNGPVSNSNTETIIRFTLSSDKHGALKIMVVVLDEV